MTTLFYKVFIQKKSLNCENHVWIFLELFMQEIYTLGHQQKCDFFWIVGKSAFRPQPNYWGNFIRYCETDFVHLIYRTIMITMITEILNQLFFLLVFISTDQKLAENNRCVILLKSDEKKGRQWLGGNKSGERETTRWLMRGGSDSLDPLHRSAGGKQQRISTHID